MKSKSKVLESLLFQHYSISIQLKELKELQARTRLKIIDKMDENNTRAIESRSYSAHLIKASRLTLDRPKLEAQFGAPLLDQYLKSTTFDQLKIISL